MPYECMTKGTKQHLKIEKFDWPISIPRSTDDYNLGRFVHCTVCDNLAYFRVIEDAHSVTKVNYYCKNCVGKCSFAQLELLNLQIGDLEGKIASNEQVIAAKAAEAQNLAQTVDAQKSEIQILTTQAARLQDDIQELEQQVQDDESEIALLNGQVNETQSQLESFKRTKVSHYSLVVNQFDEGIVLPIEVEIIPSGEGTVSIDVKNVEYETGFQDAVRTAVSVASDYSDVSVTDKDIIIRVVNEYNDGLIILDGGSAGALITGMIAAGLMDREINPSVLVTGIIELDGTVGNIGSLDKKADAAADFGAETILVPEDQEYDHDSIRVIGVSDIGDVMRYSTS
jgi:predicted ATP-dependent protease